MSVAFSSDSEQVLRREVNIKGSVIPTENQVDISSVYELEKCKEWIVKNNVKMVALQFPDEMLCNAVEVNNKLQELLPDDVKLYILGDTSFGSCCVDEVAAEHANCDSIIHFGHSCLSAPSKLKVLYALGHYPVSWTNLIDKLKTNLSTDTKLLVVVDTLYNSHLEKLEELLLEFSQTTIIGKPIFPGETAISSDDKNLHKLHRSFALGGHSIDDFTVLFIGEHERTLTNTLMAFINNPCYSYSPVTSEFTKQDGSLSKSLMRRHYLVEKAKDSQIFGILVGTLGVRNYLKAVMHLRNLIKAANRRSYTLAVGKINVAKLANFQEIDMFVYVACAENTFFDSKEFFRPVITPFELELALNPNREWGSNFYTDFEDILPGGAGYMDLPEDMSETTNYDISLISGRIRRLGKDEDVEVSAEDGSSALIEKEGRVAISHLHRGAAGDFLNTRSWQGLNPEAEAPAETGIKKGRAGIACGYQEEGS